ncbi:carbonic anhydrase [Pseudonocardia sp. RS010]|uniref:carbonic anhydrase n=1 Tax=Pseudonocardia sp. RS010 TaxID=3385979 RepID=UPI00399F5ECC
MTTTDVVSPSRPSTPAGALVELLEGNRRFVVGRPEHPNQDSAHRARSAAGQRPFAVILGCSDSRVAAEIVFDRGLGDLFVVRTAGHLLGAEVLASVEFAVLDLDVPLVVVLGHDHCGAVKAAVAAHDSGHSPSGHRRLVVERLSPEILRAQADGICDREAITRLHIASTAQRLLDEAPALRRRVEVGRCAVAGLGYTLAEGYVRQVVAHGNLPRSSAATTRARS